MAKPVHRTPPPQAGKHMLATPVAIHRQPLSPAAPPAAGNSAGTGQQSSLSDPFGAALPGPPRGPGQSAPTPSALAQMQGQSVPGIQQPSPTPGTTSKSRRVSRKPRTGDEGAQ